MATPASVWTGDASHLNEQTHELCGPPCVWGSSPPAGWTWKQQFSPHLQRNKQLQEVLMQREEELARLQEENCRLREFLGSSLVRNLQEEAQKLGVASRAALKKTHATKACKRPRLSTHRLLPSKRVCRNLTAEFCSESPESPSEPSLDLWVLRTLGLKDRDTIDTSSQSLPDFSDWDSSSYGPGSAFDSPVSTATPSSVHSCCRGAGSEPDCRFSAGPDTPENCSTFAGISVYTGSDETRTRIFRTWTPGRPDLWSSTACSPVHSPDQNPAGLPFWSPPSDRWTPPENLLPPPLLTSTPTSNQFWASAGSWNRTSPSDPPEVQTPRRSTDVAFSMFLRPSSSVKTHSFPQGQAFVRRDPGGRCNFTWVPRLEP